MINAMTDLYTQAAEAIQSAKHIYITAGAGMGIDSGLPDFRGDEGFWRAYPALKGHSFAAMANPQWFRRDPTRAWGFYGHRLNLYRSVTPHAGFGVLRKWAADKDHFIFTSNVDGAFQKAGFSEDRINECHGSIHHLQYVDPNYGEGIWSADDIEVEVDLENVRAAEPLPRRNGRLLRPNVLMFGDGQWLHEREIEQDNRRRKWMSEIDPFETVVVEMGAGDAIPTVRYASEYLQEQGATLIRINPRDSYGPEGTISIPSGAMASLLAIDERIN